MNGEDVIDTYKTEVSAYSGVNSSSLGKHPLVGGTIGAALNRNIQLFFEPSYAAPGALGHLLNFNGGVEIGFPARSKVEPFIDGVVGYSRYTYASLLSTVTASSVVENVPATSGAMTYGGGGGLRYFVGQNWGLMPVFRWQRNQTLADNIYEFRIGIFRRFGGR
jgi:hypothetical protein